MRRFELIRKEDPSGVSGTGLIAQGLEFDDGTVAMRWLSNHPATTTWDTVDDLLTIHGHDGTTYIFWLDSRTDSPEDTVTLARPEPKGNTTT